VIEAVLACTFISSESSQVRRIGVVAAAKQFHHLRREAADRDNLIEFLVEHCRASEEKSEDLVVTAKAPSPRPQNVLFLCTQNSARSIMAECAMNRWGGGRFRAFSAGSTPRGTVHPITLQVLTGLNYETDALSSKSWNDFALADGPPLDFVFTLCDRAAAETYPAWPGQPIRAHWGIEDPVSAAGSDRARRRIFAKVTRSWSGESESSPHSP
jgi:arsenate reductase